MKTTFQRYKKIYIIKIVISLTIIINNLFLNNLLLLLDREYTKSLGFEAVGRHRPGLREGVLAHAWGAQPPGKRKQRRQQA